MDEEVNTITDTDYEALVKLYDKWEREYINDKESYTARLCLFAYFEGARAYQSLHQL